eukprot:100662-Rhodomonas_salina.2
MMIAQHITRPSPGSHSSESAGARRPATRRESRSYPGTTRVPASSTSSKSSPTSTVKPLIIIITDVSDDHVAPVLMPVDGELRLRSEPASESGTFYLY